MSRCLRVLALLIVAFSISSHAQSLGDVARQVRAERQNSNAPHARVITNDDFADLKPDSAPPQEVSSEEGAGKEGDPVAPAAPRKKPAKTPEAQEIETQKRTHEINQRYLDRIAALRVQLNTAQVELAKLQQDQIESTNQFRQTLGVSPNPSTYEQQQRTLTEQITAHRDLIQSLNSQVEDAEESARHAGVPHASN